MLIFKVCIFMHTRTRKDAGTGGGVFLCSHVYTSSRAHIRVKCYRAWGINISLGSQFYLFTLITHILVSALKNIECKWA